jgi:hypothetical protein
LVAANAKPFASRTTSNFGAPITANDLHDAFIKYVKIAKMIVCAQNGIYNEFDYRPYIGHYEIPNADIESSKAVTYLNEFGGISILNLAALSTYDYLYAFCDKSISVTMQMVDFVTCIEAL